LIESIVYQNKAIHQVSGIQFSTNESLNPNYALEICDESSKCNKIMCLTLILTRKRGNHHGEHQNWWTCLILKQLELGIES